MKQEEKTRKTRERILAAAMVEFGTKSYETASLTAICEKDQLSKGLLYHNFKGKDALYLACVSRCYEEMTACFTSQTLDFTDASGALGRLMAQRQQFFQSYPYCANIFFGTILHPPEHLRRAIEEIRQELNSFYTGCYREILGHLPLRRGVTMEMAISCMMMLHETFNSYFQNLTGEGTDYHSLIEDHEEKLTCMVDMLLYGIVEQRTGEDQR